MADRYDRAVEMARAERLDELEAEIDRLREAIRREIDTLRASDDWLDQLRAERLSAVLDGEAEGSPRTGAVERATSTAAPIAGGG